MAKRSFRLMGTVFLILAIITAAGAGEEAPQKTDPPTKSISTISLSTDMSDRMLQEASKVGEQFQSQAQSLFQPTPLGWNFNTLEKLYQWVLHAPTQVPILLEYVIGQTRLLGALGSILVFIFVLAVFYSLFGQARVFRHLERAIEPLRNKMTDTVFPYFLALLKIVVAALIPLLLMGGFYLINAFINYRAAWFLLIGNLLGLWAIVIFLIKILQECLIRDLFSLPKQYGRTLYRISAIIVFYIAGAVAIFQSAAAFSIPEDILAFLKFIISISIVFILILLLRKKKALLSLLPDLPYPSYQIFLKYLNRYYFLSIFLTVITGLLWCIGYKRFCTVIWTKTWAVAAAYVVIMLSYHLLLGYLNRWAQKSAPLTEEADLLFRSAKLIILYLTVTASVMITLHLLGVLNPLERIMSFPIMHIGASTLTLWIISKAILFLVAFIFGSRLLRAYLDYKFYPAIGIDAGLAYALNTFLNYLLLAVGFLFAMKIVGIDLRVLMVFAGALGIGIGLGLQNLAANMISGFSLIFGRQIRKGDWIEMDGHVGVIKEITLRATKLETRDNIEYIIPNDHFISNKVINYTLSSPMIRLPVDVGVSYDADPLSVVEILLAAAKEYPEVCSYRQPEVFFSGYGDNSINFQLLVWLDISQIGLRRTRSKLYFTIFKKLKEAGIAIPFPQRDIHIRSGLPELAVGPTAG